jgi:hypothetical protein
VIFATRKSGAGNDVDIAAQRLAQSFG